MPPQSCTHSETQLQNSVETASQIVCNSNNLKRLCKSTKQSHCSGKNECNSGLLQQIVLVSKPGKNGGQ